MRSMDVHEESESHVQWRPQIGEVAQYLDENRKETNRYYYRQYEHHADYSFADPDYVDAHSVKLGESPESVLIRREAYAALEHAPRELTDDRRRLFLRTEENWTFEQIAAAEGVSADAVRHHFGGRSSASELL